MCARSSGKALPAFFSSTSVLWVTSSALALASGLVHGVSLPRICLYGTYDGGSNSPSRKRTRSTGRNAASTSAAVITPAA